MFSQRQISGFGLRFTAAILLFVIAWGSTVEATHGHPAAGTSLNAQASAGYIEYSTAVIRDIAVEQKAPARSSSRPILSSECLICQLHHNLATTVLAQPATVDAFYSEAARPLAPAPVHLLEFAIAQPGRAPPVLL